MRTETLKRTMTTFEKFKPPTPIPEELMSRCAFLTNRYRILPLIPKDSIGAEVGVLAADFSTHILQVVRPSRLHLIDVFLCDDYPGQNRFNASQNLDFVADRLRTEIADGTVVLQQGVSWMQLAECEEESFDWIYIDAAHDYTSVNLDLRAAHSRLKPGGWLIMNDYILFDHHARTNYGVVQATNEFMVEHRYEMLYYAFHPELFCDVVLQKPEA